MDLTKKNLKGKIDGKNNLGKSALLDKTFAGLVFLLLISIFLVIIPFYRGLYFRENYIPSIAYISAIFLLFTVYKILRGEYKLIGSYLDIAVILLPTAYLFSFFFAVNVKAAFDAVLKYTCYFMLYKIAQEISRSDKNRRYLQEAVLASIFIGAVASLLTVSGYLKLNGVVIGNRIFGLYQYTNATAAVLGMGIILGLGLLLNTEKRWMNIYYQVILSTLFPVFAMTLSRGAFLVLSLILLLYLISLNAFDKIRLVLNLIIVMVSSIPMLNYYYNVNSHTKTIMAILVVNIIIAVALQLGTTFLYKKSVVVDKKKISMTVSVLLITLISLGVIAFSVKDTAYKIQHAANEEPSWENKIFTLTDLNKQASYELSLDIRSNMESPYSYGVVIFSIDDSKKQTELFREFAPIKDTLEDKKISFSTLKDTKSVDIRLYNYEKNSYTIYRNIVLKDDSGRIVKEFYKHKFLPEAISGRLQDISLSTENAQYRKYYLIDGIKVFKDHILIGAGGGAWNDLYRKYQSFPYPTKEAHNYYIQFVIETGIVGILALIAFFALLVKGFLKAVTEKERCSELYLYFAAFMLLIHSFIDFDLSLTAIACLLWTLIGVISAVSFEDRIILNKQNFLFITLTLTCVAIFTLFNSVSIYNAMKMGNDASKLIKTDLPKSIGLYEKAIKLDKYNGAYQIDYSQIMYAQYKTTKDKKYLAKMGETLEALEKYEPYEAKYIPITVMLYLSSGNQDKAMSAIEKYIELQPLNINAYMYKVNINYEIAKKYFSNKQHDLAIPYLENMLATKLQLESAASRSLEPIVPPKKFNEMMSLAENWIENANRIIKK